MHGRLLYERGGANADGADRHDSHSTKKKKIVGVERPDDNRAAVVLEKIKTGCILTEKGTVARPLFVMLGCANALLPVKTVAVRMATHTVVPQLVTTSRPVVSLP